MIYQPKMPDDVAYCVLETAMANCAKIREGHAWTKSGDSHRRHCNILNDLVKNFLPRAGRDAALAYREQIDAERSAMASAEA